MSALRLVVLGPVRAWVGDREVSLGSARPQAVFAMLALRAGAAVRRDDLVAGVWGQDAPATAEGSVHTYISLLRKALEPDRARGAASQVLESVGSGYRLRWASDASDLAEFRALRAQGRRQLADGDADAALGSLDAALGLWRGEALAGLSGPFAETRRRELAAERTVARELRAEAAMATGTHTDVIADLGALVAEEPLRERAYELLVLALHRSGRGAEALEVFRDARRVLVTELGVEPGPGLRAAQQLVLGGTRTAPAPPRPAPRAPTANHPRPVPQDASAPVARTFDEPVLLGRHAELAAISRAVGDLSAGRGGTLWVEGEMGIGKSALLAAALVRAGLAGYQTAHAVADELDSRFPLRLALDALGVDPAATDPRRAEVARALRERQPVGSIFASGDPLSGGVDKLVALVERLCADAPLVLVLDDLQWADESSIEVWRRLGALTRHLPLLLLGAARPVPYRPEVARLRQISESGGVVLDPAPLGDSDVADIVGRLVGAPPGPALREIAARAGGNPLYVREVADALLREQLVVVVGTGLAEVGEHAFDRVPSSLVSAVGGRLDLVSAPTREVLRWAALLGGEFSVDGLAVVLARPVTELVVPLEEAAAAGVLRDAGTRIAFRHPVLRQALYERTPAALRNALHEQAAQALARAGAPVDHVAEQLLASAGHFGGWVVDWLLVRAPALVYEAPLVAVDLLQRALRSTAVPDEHAATLRAHLSSALFRIGRDTEAEHHARRALPGLRDPDRIAEVQWTTAYVPFRASRPEQALASLRETLANPGLPDAWRARLLSLLALVQRAGLDDLDAAAASARESIEVGERAADPFAIGQSLEVLWQVDAARRDYVSALAYLDRALDVVGTDFSLTDLKLVLLDNRVFTLQCLDRLDEATDTMRLAFNAAGHGASVAALQVGAAVHRFWLGGWDEAVDRLDAVLGDDSGMTGFGLREGGLMLLHGVAALIAAHRDDDLALKRHLHAGLTLPLATAANRENCDFLVAARAAAAYRNGDHADAIEFLGGILDTRYAQMMLRHQWLPELVRMALDCDDRATARAAVEACEAEAARESTAARAAAAARRCRCVLAEDPDGLTEVAAHYRSVGRVFESAQTLEDRAVLLARSGREPEAGAALREAVGLYRGLGAAWDIRRATDRVG
ncbi:BTAD domain-containing putative transcriptional regulator [Lentzea jiangxiensis]|uniref:Transcriptional regulatory protein, C terminal n=1 Tax=Lentzea jiangxiensis TaxID=641025 RepID=A0A1H0WS08_9PSEU|nr:BTAD domain-containing putative transcriptional regulator [Lentzea jiangxiensis]SDP93504.1 Transcriptional regulatory protein, C terminal [Lentzea jiangxiensis]